MLSEGCMDMVVGEGDGDDARFHPDLFEAHPSSRRRDLAVTRRDLAVTTARARHGDRRALSPPMG